MRWPSGQVDTLLTAAGDAHSVGVDGQAALFQQVGDGLAQWWEALRGADLQGSSAVGL